MNDNMHPFLGSVRKKEVNKNKRKYTFPAPEINVIQGPKGDMGPNGMTGEPGPPGKDLHVNLHTVSDFGTDLIMSNLSHDNVGIGPVFNDQEVNINTLNITELKAEISSLVFTLDMNKIETAIAHMNDTNLKRFLDNLDEIKALAESILLRRV